MTAAAVLVVSGSSVSRALFGTLLDPERFTVHSVDSLTRALDEAAKLVPDVVILQADIVRTCPDAVERIRAAASNRVGIILTDRAFADEQRGTAERRSTGADAFVALPPDPDALEGAIRRVSGGRRKKSEARLDVGDVVESLRAQQSDEQLMRFADRLFAKLEQLDAYQLLRVKDDATQQQIDAAFRKRALEFHPDRHALVQDEEARERLYQIFIRISWAYRMVGDDRTRKRYDAKQSS